MAGIWEKLTDEQKAYFLDKWAAYPRLIARATGAPTVKLPHRILALKRRADRQSVKRT